MVNDAPPNIRFILISREIPPIGFQKLKIRRLAYGLYQEELAFTLEETRDFLKEIYGMTLSKTAVKRIDTYTEGWIGGLILVADLLKRMPHGKRVDIPFDTQPECFKEEAFKYFGEELFFAQPEMVQEVLLQSSIFKTFEPEFIASFIPGDGVREILQDIARKNLFLSAYQADGAFQGLRYHTLFREFLETQLVLRIGRDRVKALYKRAAKLFEIRNDSENAVTYYLKSNTFTQAASIIERIGMQLVQMGKLTQIADWLKALPELLVRESPWLLYYQTMTVRFTEARANLQRLRKIRALFEARGDIAGQMLSLGLMIEASNISGRDLTPMSRLLADGERLVQSDETDRYAFEKATLLLQMGIMYSLRSWNPQKGYWASRSAYTILNRFGVVPLQIYALSGAFISQQMMGDLDGAKKTNKKIERLIQKCDHPEIKTLITINLCQYYTLKGELKKALAHILQSQSEAESMGLIYLMPPLQIQDLMLRPHLNDFEAAEQTGEQLLGFAISMDNDFFIGMAHLFSGISNYHKEDFKQAEAGIKTSLHIFSADTSQSLTHLLTAKHILGMINYHLGRYERAEQAMSEGFCATDNVKGTRWEAHYFLGMALIHYERKSLETAGEYLIKAFAILKNNNIEFLMWMSLKDMARACLLTIELKVRGAAAYAAKLLSSRLSPVCIPELERLSGHRDAWIKKKAVAVLSAIHRSKVKIVRVQTLNGFEVFRDGVAMEESEWQRNKAKALLKSIIARGAKQIPKEVIIEDLWPECSLSMGEKNFKVTLHRLRKSLEPALNKTYGSSYIHLDDKRIFLDGELCEIDADAFVSLVARGKAHLKEGKNGKAKKCFDEAVSLYGSDFLYQDLCEEWTMDMRSKLKNLYVDTLLTLGRINEGRGAWKKAQSCYLKAIEADPLLESAYRRLMVIYEKQDMRSQAIRLYETCKLRLLQELNSPPADKTESIYKRIIDHLPKN